MNERAARAIMDRTNASYDAAAKAFSDSRSAFWPELRYLAEHAVPDDRVLDLGSGNGRLYPLLAERGALYTGFDASEGLLAIARERYPDANFVQGDATALPFDDAAFDVVFSFAMLHHIPSRALRAKAAQEAARVLRDGGTFIATAWDLWTPEHLPCLAKGALQAMTGMRALDVGDCEMPLGHGRGRRFLHAFTEASLRRLLEQSGFTILGTEIAARPSGERNIVVVAKKTPRG